VVVSGRCPGLRELQQQRQLGELRPPDHRRVARYNALDMRSFPSPADFVAENDLQSGLPVGRLDVGNPGYTTQITGLPLSLRALQD
jgi:hypothetical protein